MSLPAGVTTCTVSVGPIISAEGTPAAIAAKARIAQTVVHVASGTELMPATDAAAAALGASLSFALPHVDQGGFVDTNGAAITGWSYIIDVVATWANGDTQTFTANVSPVVGQSTVDVDLVARGAVPPAVLGLIQAVTTVAGLGPGPVSATALAAALVPFLPVVTIPDASTTVKGLIKTASNAVTAAGTDAGTAVTPASLAALLTAFQPHDTDLDALATAASTSYGRALLNLANQAALAGLLAGATIANPTFTGTVTVPNPVVDNAAARKKYVDDAIVAALAAYSPPGVTRKRMTANGGSIATTSLATAGAQTALDQPIAANQILEVYFRVYYWADTTDDLKIDVQVPAGATFLGSINGPTLTATSASATPNRPVTGAGNGIAVGGLGHDTTQTSQLAYVEVEGIVTSGVTAGNVQVRIAQNATTSGFPLVPAAGSNSLGVVVG